MAELAVGNRADALDIVQDAMLQLARRYSRKAPDDWPPLFYRILRNRITDHHRRAGTRHAVFATDNGAPQAQAATRQADTPEQQAQRADALARLERALARLPARQREAFLLRTWEQLDVADTARAMGCSAGSVKTHLSRALASLRTALEGTWP